MLTIRRIAFSAIAWVLAVCPPLWSQAAPADNEFFLFIGLRLEDLVMRFGTPHTVHVSRGQEIWQDDVVFVYDEGDFYIFHDRVWQIGLRSAYGIQVGDPRAAALLVFGDRAMDNGEFILYHLPAGYWPLALRVNISEERVSEIFIFRPDF